MQTTMQTTTATRGPTLHPSPRRPVEAWLLAPLLEHRRAWLVFNLAYLAAILAGGLLAALTPAIQETLWQGAAEAYSPTGSLGRVGSAYLDGRLVEAMLLTFVVNLVLGSLVFITLPSLVIPFAGLLIGVVRGLLWGLLFAPVTGFEPQLLWHVPVMLLEGEAYVIAMLGVAVWWWQTVRASGGRLGAWREGLVFQVRIYAIVTLVLAIAAIYEAVEVILILGART